MSFDTSASDFVTISELARAWRCTEQHVYAMIRRGYLPAHRIGRRVIVRRAAAQEFLQKNATTAVAA